MQWGTDPPPPPPPSAKVIPPVLIFFNPSPSPQIFYSPPSDRKWLLLHFSHMATSNKHMFIFLKLLQLIKCCHNWFLKKLKQYIKETRFYHHTFVFFMCDDLPFINATQKTLKTSKKMFQFLEWMRKNFIFSSILHIQISLLQNFSSNWHFWFLDQTCPKRFSIRKQKKWTSPRNSVYLN